MYLYVFAYFIPSVIYLDYLCIKKNYFCIKISVFMKSNKPKYRLVVDHVVNGITDGSYHQGDWLPSVNKLCTMYGLSRGTIFTALNELKARGIIEATPSVGYYISSTETGLKHKIFLLFNEFNTFKEDLYNSFVESVGDTASVDLVFHNYNRRIFDTLLSNANGKYTIYILMPGKFQGIDPALQQLDGRVFLLDHFHPELKGKYSSVAQNFELDTYNALVFGLEHLRKYKHIIMVQKNEKEPVERYNGLCTFCKEQHFDHSYIDTAKGRHIKKGEVYMVVDDRDMVFLLKQAERQKLVLGKDYGIISYNDTPLKEVLAGGITTLSTHFTLMGKTMASLINNKEVLNIENPWMLNIRQSI